MPFNGLSSSSTAGEQERARTLAGKCACVSEPSLPCSVCLGAWQVAAWRVLPLQQALAYVEPPPHTDKAAADSASLRSACLWPGQAVHQHSQEHYCCLRAPRGALQACSIPLFCCLYGSVCTVKFVQLDTHTHTSDSPQGVQLSEGEDRSPTQHLCSLTSLPPLQPTPPSAALHSLT